MSEQDHTRQSAQKAFDIMSERGIVPTPANYEIFFAYTSGENSAVSRIIGDRLKAKMPISQVMLDDLRDRFFSTARVEKALETTGQDLTGAVNAVFERLESAGRDAQAYGRALSAASGELGGNHSPEAMRKLVDGLVAATHAMEARTKDLEADLQRSSQHVSELQTKLNDVRKESLTDMLTGIANRKAFDLEIERAIELSRLEDAPMCLLMCDIDHFKAFNDTFGHQTGDQVLRLVGSCLAENVKGRDTAARYGGEEFAVILPQTALSHAIVVAEQVRQAVQAKKLVKKSTGDILGSISISVGVAQIGHMEDKAGIIARADACLYAAKKAGRNRVISETELAQSKQTNAA
ncbi:MAG TPA: GGDEF domain-containing protein [Rhizomicrobium sp.]|nr:GGDEF domain-containing protein [Rhizomicrobium sp.]